MLKNLGFSCTILLANMLVSGQTSDTDSGDREMFYLSLQSSFTKEVPILRAGPTESQKIFSKSDANGIKDDGFHIMAQTNEKVFSLAAGSNVCPSIIINQPSPVCSPTTVNLIETIDTGSIIPAGATTAYFFNGIAVADPTAINQSGIYTVYMTNLNGCADSAQVYVTINARPSVPSINYTQCYHYTDVWLGQPLAGESWSGNAIIPGTLHGQNGYFFNASAAGWGQHMLTLTNVNTGCSNSVEIYVIPAPQFGKRPGNIVVNNDAGKCEAYVNFQWPVPNNNCYALIYDYGVSPNSIYPVGTTTISFTMRTDKMQISDSFSFTITVVDNEKPSLRCAGDQQINTEPGICGAYYLQSPQAVDNCPVVKISGVRSDSLPLSSLFPLGATTITWTARDGSGNTTTCNQVITVLDVEPPLFSCPGNIIVNNSTGLCTAVAPVQSPSATDNCGIESIVGIRNDGLALGSSFPIGVTTITWTAKDFGGNIQRCTQTVTVMDGELPTIITPGWINTVTDKGSCFASNVILGNPVTGDNCGVASVTNNAPSLFNVGSTIVTWTVKDINGGTSTALQIVTVTENEKPIISGSGIQTRCFNSTGSYIIDPLVATDNCGPVTTNYVITGATGRIGRGNNASGNFLPGQSIINWTVTDISGNVSNGSTTVVIVGPINIVIPDAYTNSSGTTANTVYPGYNPASSIRLTAQVSGGSGGYSYLWSNGATGRTITVSPVSGTSYSVIVTDASGCSNTSSKFVNVVNVACGSRQVKICRASGIPVEYSTRCVDSEVATSLLQNGSFLGACPESLITSMVMLNSDLPITEAEENVSLQAYPNPGKNFFNIKVKGINYTTPVLIVVYNSIGAIVETRKVVAGESFKIGHEYIPGLYMLVLKQGTKSANIKLMKGSD